MDEARDTQEREQLIRAARAVLARGGWWGFKVESVIREAKLSTRSFYRHFQKKDDLLLEMLQRDVRQAARRLHDFTSAHVDTLARVDAYCTGVLDIAYDERIAKPTKIFAWHWHELSADYPDAIEACTVQLVEPLVEVLQAAEVSGELPGVRPADDAKAIFHLCASLSTSALSSGGRISRDEAINVSRGFIHRALRAGQPAPTAAVTKARTRKRSTLPVS